MIKRIGMENVKKFIHELNDISLLFYIDEFTRLKKSDDVNASIFSSDIRQFLELALYECVERFRPYVED